MRDDGCGGGEAPRARERQPEPPAGILAGREGAIWEVSSGKKVTRVVRRVDPNRCRIWSRHNRRYDLLSPESCADLIEGFRQQGGQEFPAIVRRVTDGAPFDYEVISGARRHWTARFLKYDFLVEERELNDLEAFRLSDVENRHREDLSDYERAVDYLQALDLYYEGSQKQMAMNLERSEGWLSRYLDLARLDPVVLECGTRCARGHGQPGAGDQAITDRQVAYRGVGKGVRVVRKGRQTGCARGVSVPCDVRCGAQGGEGFSDVSDRRG